MFKHILVVTLLMSSNLFADWIDDISQFARNKNLNVAPAIKVMEGYIEQDMRDIKECEKTLHTPHKKGLIASARDGQTKVKENLLTKKQANHKKVLAHLETLPRNQKDREKFSNQLSSIRVATDELKKLKQESSKTATVVEATKNGAAIAAQEIYVSSLKASLQTSLGLS